MLYVFDVPMYGTITQMPHAEHENATDIACVTGRPVRAVTSGEGKVHYSPTMGWVFTLTSPSGKVVTSYSHLDAAYPPGWCERGDVIGECGNTGSWSTGPHLHFWSNVRYTF